MRYAVGGMSRVSYLFKMAKRVWMARVGKVFVVVEMDLESRVQVTEVILYI